MQFQKRNQKFLKFLLRVILLSNKLHRESGQIWLMRRLVEWFRKSLNFFFFLLMLESVKNNCTDLRWSRSFFFYHSCTWHFPLKELDVVNVFVRPLHLLNKKKKKKKVKRDDDKQQPAVVQLGLKLFEYTDHLSNVKLPGRNLFFEWGNLLTRDNSK